MCYAVIILFTLILLACGTLEQWLQKSPFDRIDAKTAPQCGAVFLSLQGSLTDQTS